MNWTTRTTRTTRLTYCGLASLLVAILGALPVKADEVCALLVDYGAATPAALERELADTISTVETPEDGGLCVLEPEVVDERLSSRFGVPIGVPRDAIVADVRRAEDAYYAMSYAEVAAALDSEQWRRAVAAGVDMALEPHLAELIRRGLMTLARAGFYGGDEAGCTSALEQAVTLFPAWIPDTSDLQPELVTRYLEVRQDVISRADQLEIVTPSADCVVHVNGLEVGRGRAVRALAVAERQAVRVVCEAAESRVHVVGAGSYLVDPGFDARFDPDARRLTITPDRADDFDELAEMGIAFADIARVDRVILAGVLPSGELQLVDVAANESVPRAVARVRPTADGGFDVQAPTAALFGVAPPPPSTTLARREDDQIVMPQTREDERSGPQPASWIAFGVSGAGLVLGAVFAVVESNRNDDVEACRQNADCATTGRLSNLESDRARASVLTTIGFSVGLGAAIVGAIIWIVDSASDRGPNEEASTVRQAYSTPRWRPAVSGSVNTEGGWIDLAWFF